MQGFSEALDSLDINLQPRIEGSTRFSGQSLLDAEEQVRSAKLDVVFGRLTKIEGWKATAAHEGIRQYRNFLVLSLKYPDERLSPSQDIDEVWHAHILHTKEYYDFCKKVFGGYVHHYPLEHKLAGLYQNTQSIYKKEFGEPMYHVRRAGLQYIKSIFRRLCAGI